MPSAISWTFVPDSGWVTMGKLLGQGFGAGCVASGGERYIGIARAARPPMIAGREQIREGDACVEASAAWRVAAAAPGGDRGAEAELYRRMAPRVRRYGL